MCTAATTRATTWGRPDESPHRRGIQQAEERATAVAATERQRSEPRARAESPAGKPATPPTGNRPQNGRRRATRRRPRRTFAWRDLLHPRIQLPLLLVATALALLFAWQARPPFVLDLGGPDDAPYLTGFHEGE